MADNKKTIFFSIEIAARELDPKCLLALETSKRGFRVYIGSFRALKQLKSNMLSSCIFFHKSTWTKNAARITKELGAKFVFLDEEMGIALRRSQIEPAFAARFRNVSSAEYSDVFTLGDSHKRVMEALPNFQGINVHATGWPRLDLWRDEFQQFNMLKANEIRKHTGDFYLLVSSFGAISKSSREEFIRIREENGLHEHTIVDFKFHEFQKCLKLIRELSVRLKEHEKIIIRPHTSESVDQWNEYIADLDNISVCHEGDATEWMYASRGTIQFGSTLAIQAAYMGIPSIQHTFTPREGATDTTSYEILEQSDCAEDMLDSLRNEQNVDPKILRKKSVEKLTDLVSNLEGRLASEAIADRLSELAIIPQAPIFFNAAKRAMLTIKEKINYLNYLKKKKFRNESGRIKRSKFEKIPNGLKKEDIENRIKHLAEMRGDDPELVQCRQVAHNLVEIEYN